MKNLTYIKEIQGFCCQIISSRVLEKADKAVKTSLLSQSFSKKSISICIYKEFLGTFTKFSPDSITENTRNSLIVRVIHEKYANTATMSMLM